MRDCIKTFFESIIKHVIASKAKQSKGTCHPEFIWQSEQTKDEFCEPASRVAWSLQREMLTFNFYEILKQVQNDMKALFTIHNSLVKAIAFTLAETLVVMGIIGVVAALTIPNLNQSTGDREKVAKVKKVYANLEDAYGRATAVYGPIEEWFQNDGNDDKAHAKRFAERMIEFMKISKNCEFGDGCFASRPLLSTDGSQLDANYLSSLKSWNDYMVITADGTSLAFQPFYNDNSINHIRFDIDGPNSGKNQLGSDIFDVIFDTNDNYAMRANNVSESKLDGDLNVDLANSYATAWVIQNGNLDYLKCDDLNWETKTSCK